jgi:hypothetical protein
LWYPVLPRQNHHGPDNRAFERPVGST